MDGYSRDNLHHLLNSDGPIKGWCYKCDEHWTLSAEGRAGSAGLSEGR
jgi:hypothetical protein